MGAQKRKAQALQVADAAPVAEEKAAKVSKLQESGAAVQQKAADEEKAKVVKLDGHAIRFTGLAEAELEELAPVESFASVEGFTKKIVKACSKRFEKPTPIQAASWPLVLRGLDVVGIAKTGSGKTLAFTLPFLAMSEKGTLTSYEQPNNYTRMLLLAPTRELAQQSSVVAEEFVKALAPKEDALRYPVAVFVGGVPKWEQKQQISQRGADIACCTPGRLLDLANEGTLDLSQTQLFVLDEADRMLDLGFIEPVAEIHKMLPQVHQTVLFSATWPYSVDRLARKLTRKGKTVKIGVSKLKQGEDGKDQEIDEAAAKAEADNGVLKANEKVKQTVEVLSDPKEKLPRLLQILKQHRKSKVLIFGLYKKECATLEWTLQQRGFPDVKALQGDMSQDARYKVMDSFKSGQLKILIATDVASRGLDVPNIDLVVNYTFPLTIEDFVHRVGRTARGGKSGEAITLFNNGRMEGVQEEKQHAGDLVRVLREAGQPVPPALEKIADSSQGNKATKKKAHPIYGNFFKDEATMAKLEAKKVHKTFADSDDE